ncbi:hypothetical protein ACFVHS_25195 [Streptomyces sp. NPDC057746]|uniref:hypothetical protein n=1 Tax=Streptomyces sp. NPDC057746 TaxID=3346237 RepID=UPI00369D551E
MQVRDLPDGRRALLTIVNARRPGVRMAWVYWDADRMSLANDWVQARATAEAEPREGDARAIAAGEMADCFTGDHTAFWPHRDVEVRVGGLWQRGAMRCLYRGREGRAVAAVTVSLFEPGWGAWVGYKRLYEWDPLGIRPAGADLVTQA